MRSLVDQSHYSLIREDQGSWHRSMEPFDETLNVKLNFKLSVVDFSTSPATSTIAYITGLLILDVYSITLTRVIFLDVTSIH
jgi:hypothetical protein